MSPTKRKPRRQQAAETGPRVELVDLDRINPAPYNPRVDLTPEDREYQRLAGSLKQYGTVQLVVWNERSGNLVGGHQTLKALRRQNPKLARVAASIVNLDPLHERRLNALLNQGGRWDRDRLKTVLEEIDQLGGDIADVGFSPEELEQLAGIDAEVARAANRPSREEAMKALREGKEAREADRAQAEANDITELEADLTALQQVKRRQFLDALRCSNATAHLGRLPDRDEMFHCIMRGNYHAFDLIPALIKLADPGRLLELYITTLSFNRRQSAALAKLIDEGLIPAKRLAFVCSVYFQKTGGQELEMLTHVLDTRGGRCIAIRNHSKLMLARFSTGAHIVIESSANLRSCRNIEQFTATDSPDVYAFHRRWIEDVFKRGGLPAPADDPQPAPKRKRRPKPAA